MELSDKKHIKQEYYVRKENVEVSDFPLFDQILVYCPSTNFRSPRYYSFYRNGQMINYGANGSPANCTFATIKEEDFVVLENYFKQANIQKYLEQISKRGSDTFSPDRPGMIFIRGNKTYSFNNDFHLIAESDYRAFYIAYFTALFYAENLYFQPKTEFMSDDFLYDFDKFSSWKLYLKEREIILTEPEYFYLALLLRAAPETNKVFDTTCLFKDNSTREVKIQTDGQYFRFRTPMGEKTVDIGFNFIIENDVGKEI